MRKFVTVSVALASGVAAATVGYTIDDRADARPAATAGPGRVRVELDVDYSAYSRTRLRVYAGTLVEFVVHNGDPINHELVVGPAEVHARHRRGTESVHPPIPGEVSVGPGQTRLTIYRFDEPGLIEFACHLRGHYEYGMRGTIEVVSLPPT